MREGLLPKIVFVIGTRPQYIKSSIIINQLIKLGIPLKVIDTGQHYDANLSKVFLEELKFPDVINLNVGSARTHGIQTAKIIVRAERWLLKLNPKLVIVVGDTNSTLGTAITTSKLNIPIAHLEAGLRSYDMSIPEEINRVVTDVLSTILFCPSYKSVNNLLEEHVSGRIYWTGDTMYDVLRKHLPIARKRNTLIKYGIDYDYALATIHHSFNTDNPKRLKSILSGLEKSGLDIIFPIHPRTKKMMKWFGIHKKSSNIHFLSPVSYYDMLNLIRKSEMVITDSGGLQKEAFWLRKPCITLKEDTVWNETVDLNANTLVGANKGSIIKAIKNCSSFPRRITQPYGKGNASEIIIRILRSLV